MSIDAPARPESNPGKTPRLGVHLSLGTKPRVSLEQAHAHGAECVQIFASSPGAWKPPVLRELRSQEIVATRNEYDISPLFIHAIYLINLASADQVLVRRSIGSLVATLRAGAELQAAGVVTHIGSHAGRGFDDVADQVAAGLREILAESPDEIDLLLENSAGQGGIIGSRIEELGVLLEGAGQHPRLKVCLDTAHLFAAGWDFADEATVCRLVDDTDARIGLDRLALLHANDSKLPCGSNRDRHAVIGEGYIGTAGFTTLLACPEIRRVPLILETPDLDTRRPEEERFTSLGALRSLRAEIPFSGDAGSPDARRAHTGPTSASDFHMTPQASGHIITSREKPS
jgi:deoxyribonuclease-4